MEERLQHLSELQLKIILELANPKKADNIKGILATPVDYIITSFSDNQKTDDIEVALLNLRKENYIMGFYYNGGGHIYPWLEKRIPNNTKDKLYIITNPHIKKILKKEQ